MIRSIWPISCVQAAGIRRAATKLLILNCVWTYLYRQSIKLSSSVRACNCRFWPTRSSRNKFSRRLAAFG